MNELGAEISAVQCLCFSLYSIWPCAIISLSIVTLLSVSMTGHCKLSNRSADGVATHWSATEVNNSHSLYNGPLNAQSTHAVRLGTSFSPWLYPQSRRNKAK